MPFLPEIPRSAAPTESPVRVHDTSTGTLREVVPVDASGPVRLYVCGITPYDATHLGHAATYLAFDLLGRALRDAGHEVRYVQNITDIDDPLLERAERDGIDWRDLATREIALFREDMTALAVIPPNEYLGAVESIPSFVGPIEQLVARDAVYPVPAPDAVHDGGTDWYFDLSSDPSFGEVGHLSHDEMLELFAERGGDPDRAGKRSPLDPLMWRAERDGEPAWPGGSLGAGRPGWHIECACIALDHLGLPFDVQGGGSDLIFPHHEMSAAHGRALTGEPFAQAYVHQGMVGYQGEKMSKSRGNLVLVSQLRRDGVDPMAIRLALLAHHHTDDWEWTEADLSTAQQRLATWRAALSGNGGPPWEPTLFAIRAALREGLDSPAALDAVDAWAARALTGEGGIESVDATTGDATNEGADPASPGVLARAIDALLGVRL